MIFGTLSLLAVAEGNEDKRAIQLQNEQRRLEKTKDPTDRTKSLIKIAEIQLDYANDGVQQGNFFKMQSALDQYREAMTGARDTMLNSGLDPYKHSGGYRAVELAIRKHVRILQDTARSLSLAQRAPVEETVQVISKIRDEFLKALFK